MLTVVKSIAFRDTIDVNGVRCGRIRLGSATHGAVCVTLYVTPNVASDGGKLVLPAQGVDLKRVSADGYAVVPGSYNLFGIHVERGYRGSAEFTVESEATRVIEYPLFHSPLGRLGVSKGGLILTSAPDILVSWSRTGRTYGGPQHGRCRIHLDGTMQDADYPAELADLIKLSPITRNMETD
jgi:hypothetical protein